MGRHARLSASAASRWMACPGSVQLSAALPNTSSIYADFGTMAHSIASYCLRKGLNASAIVEDYADEIQSYLDFCRSEMQQPQDEMAIELDVSKSLRRIDPDIGGTLDFCRWRRTTGELLVVDFKFGSGVQVDVLDNKQLRTYGVGALLHFGGKGIDRVRVVVHQPRLENPEHRHTEEIFPAVELLDFVADMRVAALASRSPSAPIVPGVDQCRWCPAAKAKICDRAVKFAPKKPVGTRVTPEDFDILP